MEKLLQDLRFGLRMLRKSPGFAVVAILTLALCIGANTAIFTVVNAVLLHPLNVSDPDRLMGIFMTDEHNRGGQNNFMEVSQPNGADIGRLAQSFSGVSLYTAAGVSVTIDGTPRRFTTDIASGNFFDVLGVKAMRGRVFEPRDDVPERAQVVVLSYGFWTRNLASDPGVIGRTLLINGQGFAVIGVAPRGFQGTAAIGGSDMWVPLAAHDQILTGVVKQMFSDRRFGGFIAVGRLKDGYTKQQAAAELRTIGSQLEHDYPVPNRFRSFAAVPLLESTLNPNTQGLFVRAGMLMMVVVGVVLLIACANISNLLLARAAARKREISIRLALGASRGRVMLQLLVESTVLALVGGIVGLALGAVARNVLWSFRPPFLQDAYMSLSLDNRVLAFTLLVALFTGIVFGLAPALQASRPDLVTELKERVRSDAFSGRRIGLRSLFVIGQFALSLVALIGAGLFVISLNNAQKIDPGFNIGGLGMLSFDLDSMNYDPARAREFERRALETALAVPGVQSATLATNVPLFGGTAISRTVFPEGQESTTRAGVFAQTDLIAPGYFEVMGVPVLRGRRFTEDDREDTQRVAIINEAAARRYWPDQDAVGKRFKFFGDTTYVQVVGVARDAKYFTLGEDPTPYMYLPIRQNPTGAVTLFFRTSGDPRLALSGVRTQVQALDRNLPLTNVWPIGEVISQALWAAKFSAGLLAVFAGLAVVLAAIGLYGVVAYSVGQRVREIGIRMAIGAKPADILSMIVRQSAKTLAIGLVTGLITSYLLARLITSLLYGVSAASPLPFTVLPMLLAVVGLIATAIPALRATKVNPIVALRNE
jgi:predicted permease